MSTQKQVLEHHQQQQQQSQMMRVKTSGILNYSASPMNIDDKEEEMTMSALLAFRAKEEEIERKKAVVRERVQAQLCRVEEETKKLAEIREELEALADPMRKEVALIRKKVDLLNRELKPLGQTCQRKEKEYKETLDAFNEKSREKTQLISKLMELVSESEKLRMKKLEELSKNIDSLH
ncbi:hypothetical protein ACH5RR_021086 [Cinchona calisaya]|uniref:RAB6-interacting golgin n=1 Tax=Cinchona calisaya TaxID=153742 RepID=A0ABD2ZJ91_9GENT